MNKNNRLRLTVLVMFVIGFTLVIAATIATPMTTSYSYTTAGATLTADGEFDMVKLVDRHFGDYNGMEVEDELLAVLYESGTVYINNTHYEGSYLQDKGFPFFLYIYYGIEHLRERIIVNGNTAETYEFVNVTITVSLIGTRTVVNTDNSGFGRSVIFGLGLFLVIVLCGSVYWNETKKPVSWYPER